LLLFSVYFIFHLNIYIYKFIFDRVIYRDQTFGIQKPPSHHYYPISLLFFYWRNSMGISWLLVFMNLKLKYRFFNPFLYPDLPSWTPRYPCTPTPDFPFWNRKRKSAKEKNSRWS